MAIAEVAKDSQTTTSWVQALEIWESLPAQAPIWDDVDEFVEALRKVTSAKLLERNAGRDALRKALEELCAGFGDDLEYFETRACAWQADSVSRTEAQGIADRVGELHAEMRGRKALIEKPAAHYAEAKRQREEISAMEDTIFGHLSALSGKFEAQAGGASSEDTPSPAPTTATESPPPSVVEELAVPGSDHHALIDSGSGRYSPLTRSQEKSILSDAPGVGLIFASGALGFEHLPDAVTHLVSTATSGRGAYGAMPPSVSTEQGIYDWIANFSAGNPGAERLVICQPAAVPSPDIINRFQGALKYCNEHAKAPIRVLFFLAPGAVGAWLTLPKETWQSFDGRLKPIFSLKPWTLGAVQDRLERQNKLYDAETCRLAMEATGGWSWCVDKLFEMCGKSPDPKEAARKMSGTLFPDLGGTGELRDELMMRIGVRPDTVSHAVMDLIHSETEVPVDLLAPDMIEMETTPDECRAAVEFLQALSVTEGDNGVIRMNPFLARVLGKKPEFVPLKVRR